MQGAEIFLLPCDLQGEEEEGKYSPPDPYDGAEIEHGGAAPARAGPLDPLANFIKELEDVTVSLMSGSYISALLSDLPGLHDGNVEGML